MWWARRPRLQRRLISKVLSLRLSTNRARHDNDDVDADRWLTQPQSAFGSAVGDGESAILFRDGCKSQMFANSGPATISVIYRLLTVDVYLTTASSNNGRQHCLTLSHVLLPRGYYFGITAASGSSAISHTIKSIDAKVASLLAPDEADLVSALKTKYADAGYTAPKWIPDESFDSAGNIASLISTPLSRPAEGDDDDDENATTRLKQRVLTGVIIAVSGIAALWLVTTKDRQPTKAD